VEGEYADLASNVEVEKQKNNKEAKKRKSKSL